MSLSVTISSNESPISALSTKDLFGKKEQKMFSVVKAFRLGWMNWILFSLFLSPVLYLKVTPCKACVRACVTGSKGNEKPLALPFFHT